MADDTTELIRKILAGDSAPVSAYRPGALPAPAAEHTTGFDSGPSFLDRAATAIGNVGTGIKEGLFGKSQVVPGSGNFAPPEAPPAAPATPSGAPPLAASAPVTPPPQPAPVARVPAGTGALPAPAPIQGGAPLNATDQEDQTDLAPTKAPDPMTAKLMDVATRKPVTDKPTLVEQYSAALEKLKSTDTSGKLTPDQQRRAELSFWLNMLAAASQPGARAGGAVGYAGVEALKGMTEQEKENRKAAIEMLKSNKDDLYKLAVMADKQGDNERAAQQLAMMEQHYAKSDESAAEHMRILREQVEQGRFKTIAQAGLPLMAYDTKGAGGLKFLTGPDGKPIVVPQAPGPQQPAEMQMLNKWAHASPAEREDMKGFFGALGKGKEERDREAEALNKTAADLLSKDMTGKMTPEDARTKARAVMGLSPEGGASVLPDPAANAGRTMVDTRTGKKLKSDGKTWVPVG